MARAGFKDFRTNTFLGNLVFHAKLPLSIQELAVKCGKTLGKGSEAWIFALDAMVKRWRKQECRRCLLERRA